jgi:hypothetical protein
MKHERFVHIATWCQINLFKIFIIQNLVCCQSWKTTNRETTTTVQPSVQSTEYDAVDLRGDYDLERHRSMKLLDLQQCGPVFGEFEVNINSFFSL